MLKFINGKESDLTGKVLLFPAISIGGVGTLVLDMFISNNKFERVGYFATKYLEPCVGMLPDSIAKETLGLPAEIYLNGDIVILQIRSRPKTGRKEALAKQLEAFRSQYNFRQVIMVSSMSNSIRPDSEISSGKQNIYVKVKGETTLKLEGLQKLQVLYDQGEKTDEDEQDILEHSGLSLKVFKYFQQVAGFFIFSDPVWDIKTAVKLAKRLREVLGFKELSEQITIVPEDRKV